MNYSAMIQNRKSVRAFRGKEVPNEALAQLRTYYEKTCPRLVPEIATELIVLDKDAQPALESSAGYQQFLIGAPHYLMLLSAPHIHAEENAGYRQRQDQKGSVPYHPAGGGGHRGLRLRGKDGEKAADEHSEHVADRRAGRAAVLRAEKERA